MEFSEFFEILWEYLNEAEGDSKERPQFFIKLIDLILREPQTDSEDTRSEKGELNPFGNKEPDTVNKYCSGSRKIPKKAANDVLSRISDGRNFIQEIDFAYPSAKKGIRNKLRLHNFEVTASSLGSTCFEILKAFFEKFANGQKTVTQSDIKSDQLAINYLRLVQDVNLKCSLCGTELIDGGLSNTISGYDVVRIYPDNLGVKEKVKFNEIKEAPEIPDALENLIPLCLNCANSYLKKPTLEVYRQLVQKKKEIANEKKIAKGLNQLTLEEQLSEVIRLLRDVKPSSPDSGISYDAHKVEEKINQDYPLQWSVNMYVMGYYNKIKEQFSNMEGDDFSFDELADEIRLAYHKLKREKLSQTELFNRLANWILEKEKLDNSYLEAARIIVAFFVQNCEVFEVENAK